MHRLQSSGLSAVRALCTAQLATAAICAGVVWAVWGAESARAALFGGLVAVAPVAYFGLRVFLRRGGLGAGDVLGAFYRAEAGKLALTAGLFVIGAKLFGAHFAPLMFTFMACLAMNWLLLAVTGAARVVPNQRIGSG